MSRVMVRGASVLVFLTTWWLVTGGFHLFRAILLPSPIDVARGAYDLAIDGGIFRGGLYRASLLGHILISLYRVMVGFLLALLIALPTGLIIGRSKTVKGFISPLIEFGRQIPPIAFVPLAIVWFGLGVLPIVFIIFVAAFWAIIVNVIAGMESIPTQYIHAAGTLGANRRQTFFRVELPAAFPYIFVGIRVGMGTAWISIVAAELIAGTSGLGYMIMNARRVIAADHVIAGMATIGVIGVAFDLAFRGLEARMVRG